MYLRKIYRNLRFSCLMRVHLGQLKRIGFLCEASQKPVNGLEDDLGIEYED